jgi:hypothetical protein
MRLSSSSANDPFIEAFLAMLDAANCGNPAREMAGDALQRSSTSSQGS